MEHGFDSEEEEEEEKVGSAPPPRLYQTGAILGLLWEEEG